LLTQEKVAGALGVGRTTVAAMEAGTRKVTALELLALSRLYGRSLNYLLGVSSGSGELNKAMAARLAGLSDDDCEQVLAFAEFLAAKRHDKP
jgi:transcriptional regulator with XRE-family HTH domain